MPCRLNQCISDTAHCTGLNLCLALSYSARWEITQACKNIAQKTADGEINSADITDELISKHLTTANMPDPDLMIRTGGDMRVSNFLLWQIAYAEICVVDKYWPDYSKDDFCNAIIQYQSRERRFGMTSEQINNENN